VSTVTRAAVSRPNLPQWFTAIVSSCIASAQGQPPAARPQVLVIEQDSALRELMSLYLGQKGLEVATVHSAREAKPLVQRAQVNLLILDWTQDGAGGRELVRFCKTQRPEIMTVVFTTAPAETAQPAAEAHANGRLSRTGLGCCESRAGTRWGLITLETHPPRRHPRRRSRRSPLRQH
jgi:CheY-like chemotaxis protein